MKKKIVNHWRNNLLLFLSIVFLFIIRPAIVSADGAPIITALFFSILVVSGIYAADYPKIVFKILAFFGGVALVTVWMELIIPNDIFGVLTPVLISLVLILITWALITHVASSKIVNADILFSSINGYLLIGIVGALAFRLIMLNNPDALSITLKPGEGFDQLVYFSYVTLSTLGYGEITPISPGARAVAMVLSLTGPLYLAILIAFLVGNFQSQKQKE